MALTSIYSSELSCSWMTLYPRKMGDLTLLGTLEMVAGFVLWLRLFLSHPTGNPCLIWDEVNNNPMLTQSWLSRRNKGQVGSPNVIPSHHISWGSFHKLTPSVIKTEGFLSSLPLPEGSPKPSLLWHLAILFIFQPPWLYIQLFFQLYPLNEFILIFLRCSFAAVFIADSHIPSHSSFARPDKPQAQPLSKQWTLRLLVTTMTSLCHCCSMNSSFFSNRQGELCSMQTHHFPAGNTFLETIQDCLCLPHSWIIFMAHAQLLSVCCMNVSSPLLFPADELPAYSRNPSYFSLSPCSNKVFSFLIPV